MVQKFWAFIFGVIFLGAVTNADAQTTHIEGNKLVLAPKAKASQDIHANCTKTSLSVEVGGKTYPVYVTTKSGAAFIFAKSKAGKEYRKYLGKEATEAVAKALGK